MGVEPQPSDELASPVNQFEQEFDKDGSFRLQVNHILCEEYQAIFSQLDSLIYLNGMSFDRVYQWRLQQEHMLKASTGKGMSDEQVRQFIQPFQRLSVWGMQSLPNIADIEVCLGEDRAVLQINTQLGE